MAAIALRFSGMEVKVTSDQKKITYQEVEKIRSIKLTLAPDTPEYKRKGFYVNGLSSDDAKRACSKINEIANQKRDFPHDIELHEVAYYPGRDHVEHSAFLLSCKVQAWLDGDGRTSPGEVTPRVALFGHSAGAYVVARAYEHLENLGAEYTEKVRVVLFGGVASIKNPDNTPGLSVLGFWHKRDVWAILGHIVTFAIGHKIDLEALSQIKVVDSPSESSIIPHSADEYLENKNVKMAIQWAMYSEDEPIRKTKVE